MQQTNEMDKLKMKFRHSITMKAKMHKSDLKNGIERDKGQFDGLKPGDIKLIKDTEIIGKHHNGEPYIMIVTGYERFTKNEERKQ